MSSRTVMSLISCVAIFLGTAYALDRTLPHPFQEYPGVEYRQGSIPLPPGAEQPTEWTFARLMYPGGWNDGYAGREAYWTEGFALWTQDYPRADRHFSEAVGRLTRVDVRPVEQAVNLDDGNQIYNWPWLYAVQVGEWGITDDQAKKLRDYLLRGRILYGRRFPWDCGVGRIRRKHEARFFLTDPSWTYPIAIRFFTTVYDLGDRYQIVGAEHLETGHKLDGYVARWRGIYDDKGRIMVAASFNSDIGDSWEWADSPEYPEKYSALGVRIGVNYIVYAMTH